MTQFTPDMTQFVADVNGVLFGPFYTRGDATLYAESDPSVVSVVIRPLHTPA